VASLPRTLQTLDFGTRTPFVNSRDFFAALPPCLTSLNFNRMTDDKHVDFLPKSLTHAPWLLISQPEQLPLVPPQGRFLFLNDQKSPNPPYPKQLGPLGEWLQHLVLSSEMKWSNFELLPQKLVSLHIFFALKHKLARCLPPSLRRLHVQSNRETALASQELLRLLPRRLESLQLSRSAYRHYNLLDSVSAGTLPPALTNLDLGYIMLHEEAGEWFEDMPLTLKSLSADIKGGLQVSHFASLRRLPHLLKLELKINNFIEAPSEHKFTWKELLANLPTRLTELRLLCSDTRILAPEYAPEDLLLLPPGLLVCALPHSSLIVERKLYKEFFKSRHLLGLNCGATYPLAFHCRQNSIN